jgi:hypothetical protein
MPRCTRENAVFTANFQAGGSARDLALGDAGADVVLRAVGVERDLRSIKDAQQLAHAAMEPREQPVEEHECTYPD